MSNYVMQAVAGKNLVRTIAVYETEGGSKSRQVDIIGRYRVGENRPLEFDCEKYCKWQARPECKIRPIAKLLAEAHGCNCRN